MNYWNSFMELPIVLGVDSSVGPVDGQVDSELSVDVIVSNVFNVMIEQGAIELDPVEVLGVLEASLDDVISKKRVQVSKNFAESNPLLFSTCTHRYHHSQNRLTFPAGYTKHY